MGGIVLPWMPYIEYAKLPGVNWTGLKPARDSMLHYFDAKAAPFKETRALRVGKAVHTATTEPHRFLAEYALKSEGINRRTKKGKEQWANLVELNSGKTILAPDEYEEAIKASQALRAHHLTAPYLERGRAEVSIQWTDEETGILCKSRLDWVTGRDIDDPDTICEIKTARSIKLHAFASQAESFGYFHQFAFQQRGFASVWGGNPAKRFLVAENHRPFDCGVIEPMGERFDLADEEISALLLQVKGARASGKYHGMYRDEKQVDRPRYVVAGDSDAEEAPDGPITY